MCVLLTIIPPNRAITTSSCGREMHKRRWREKSWNWNGRRDWRRSRTGEERVREERREKREEERKGEKRRHIYENT